MTKFVCWDEPLYTKGPVYGGIMITTPEECIGYQKVSHPDFEYVSDMDALDDFMVVNRAWFVELDGPYPWKVIDKPSDS